MRKLVLLLLLSLCWHGLYAKSKVIVNPSYEVKNTGIVNVIKIELSDTETRLTIHNTFIPRWWIDFSKEEVITDSESGKKYQVTGIEGAEFGKKIVMPASGDSTIVLIFPPLDKSVKKIDYNSSIFGISLKKKRVGKKELSVVPKAVTKWLKAELSKVPRKAPLDFKSDQFFNSGVGRLVGYIKGYDTRLGFTTGVFYANNYITREDFPIVIQIHPDGRFEANIPMISPQYTKILINDKWFPFYLEPEQTLSMILDWEEFLTADRLRNIRYKFKNIIYQGPLAKLNNDLLGFSPKQFNYKAFQKQVGTLSPEDFKQAQLSKLTEDMQKLENHIKNSSLSLQTSSILRNQVLHEYGTRMFNFVSRRKSIARKDTSNKILKMPVPISYYDFLKQIPLDDKSLLVSGGFRSFVNSFEYCDPLFDIVRKKSFGITPEKIFIAYLQEEGVTIPKEDKELYVLIYKENKTQEEFRILASKGEKIQALNEKYKDKMQAYAQKYIVPIQKASRLKNALNSWTEKDSVLISELGLKPNLVYEIIKVRSLAYEFKQTTREGAETLWNQLKSGISESFLIEEGNRMFKEAYSVEKPGAYELPKGVATDIFRKIIAPFKGKILFVDFWATSCGPCVGGIKSMKASREKYSGNKDFDFIFITNESRSPEARYTKFVEEQALENTFRLSNDDYNYLSQLFKFNGIPRYVLIDKQGNVLNDDFQMHNFESELKDILSGS